MLVALAAVALSCLFGLSVAAAGEPDVGQTLTDARQLADNGETVFRCATVDRGNPKNAPDKQQIDLWISENRIAAGGVINVHFHVIRSRSGEGDVPLSQLQDQITVLNRNYAGQDYNGNPVPGAKNTGYTFVLASVDRTANNKWFRMTPGTAAESQAKNALAINQNASLNLYTCKPGQNLLGWSTFPWDLQANGKLDGVVVHYGSVPGGYISPYNLGGTASHEVGHWVGLYHTFQGGCDGGNCSGAGDLVCDTPGEGTATSGCPSGKDTCPEAGLDPIHNYMDYSTDICYNNFTTGQDARADFMMSTYRPLIGSARFANQSGSFQAAKGGAEAFGLRAVPNPFNPRTKIEFSMPREGHALVRVYDIQGRTVATIVNSRLSQGAYRFELDGDRLASGIYMLQLRVDGRPVDVRRISPLK
jgi:hypothetical protein